MSSEYVAHIQHHDRSCKEDKKCRKCCEFPAFDNACDLFHYYRKSVVTVTTMTILSTLAGGVQPTGTPTDTAVIYNAQDGFFIGGGDGNQGLLLTPAQGVLINPTLLGPYNRYPGEPGIVGLPPGAGITPNRIAQVSEIFVDVQGVTKKKKKSFSYSYRANIVGVDGAGNWALLKINQPTPPQNEGNPKLKCLENIPYFCRTGDNDICDGQDVYLLGDFSSRAAPITLGGGGIGIIKGNVIKHRYTNPDGRVLPELVLISAAGVHNPKLGGPVVDIRGQWLGMVVANTTGVVPQSTAAQNGNGVVAAISGRAIEPSIHAILMSTIKKCRGVEGVATIPDSAAVGGGFRYRQHNYLGINYRLVDSLTFAQNPTDTATAPYITYPPRLPTPAPLAPGGLVVGPACKRTVGLQVLALAGAATPLPGGDGLFIPGLAGAPAFVGPFVDSPLLGSVAQGDIIVEINGCPIGNRPTQITPSLVLWGCPPPCSPSTCDNNVYTLLIRTFASGWEDTAEVEVGSIIRPLLYEYPWWTAASQAPITAPVAVTSPIIPVANFAISVL